MISNKLLQDRRISYATKGVISTLLSHPNDWVIRVCDLIREGGEGEKKILSIIKEAKQFSYMGTFKVRALNGRIIKHYYWVTDDCANPPTDIKNDEIVVEINGQYVGEQTKNKPDSPKGVLEGKKGLTRQPKRRSGKKRLLSNENNGVSMVSPGPPKRRSGYSILPNNIQRDAAAAAKREISFRAVEVFQNKQELYGFDKPYNLTTDELDKISVIIEDLGGGEIGLQNWSDLLDKAGGSDWHCGKIEPGQGYAVPYRLSITDMTKIGELSKLDRLKIKISPNDERWLLWLDYARHHDYDLAKRMTVIMNSSIPGATWDFPHSYPPTGKQS